MSDSIDWEQFDAVVGDGSDGMLELFHEFVADVQQKFIRLKEATEKNDGTALAWDAHQLKGSAGSFGMQAVSKEVSLLEELGKAEDFAEATVRLPKLETLFEESVARIRAERPSLGL